MRRHDSLAVRGECGRPHQETGRLDLVGVELEEERFATGSRFRKRLFFRGGHFFRGRLFDRDWRRFFYLAAAGSGIGEVGELCEDRREHQGSQEDHGPYRERPSRSRLHRDCECEEPQRDHYYQVVQSGLPHDLDHDVPRVEAVTISNCPTIPDAFDCGKALFYSCRTVLNRTAGNIYRADLAKNPE